MHGATMNGESLDIGHRPAHPGGGKLEGRELRVVDDLAGRYRAPDAGTDAEPQRVTCGEHDNPLTTQENQLIYQGIERTGPGQTTGGHTVGQGVVAIAADDDFGSFDNGARGGGQAVETVLADADDMEPRRVRHGVICG